MTGLRPCIVVAGMGRCGTSVMMQALDAMGVPCIGGWPDYETEESSVREFSPFKFRGLHDVAIKLIDPFRLPQIALPLPHHVVLWMVRDFRQQAKSQVKLLKAGGVRLMGPDRQVARAFRARLGEDERRNIRALGIGPQGTPGLDVRFENLIAEPLGTMAGVTAYLHRYGWHGLDPALGAAQVLPRSADCYEGMFELEVMARRVAS